jgi:MYXO-CTERM domain-containing protein
MRNAKKLTISGALALAATLGLSGAARAEPTEPIVVGWWSYFSNQKVPTPSTPQHMIDKYGDPDVYYYDPSGGHGLQEDPNVLPKDQAWQNIINYILAQANGVSLQPQFSINTSSDLQTLQEAYFGYALVLLYVPKDKYCDKYQVHIGTVDDGVQAMANAEILGYDTLGEQNKYIDMVAYNSNPPKLVLRPGINEVVLIHVDQAKVQRYVTDVWIEHDGQKVPLAPKNVAFGRITDKVTGAPLYEATAGVAGNGVNDTFVTGPLGFYLFPGLADGQYQLTAQRAKYKDAMGSAAVQMGQAQTEVVRTDFPLEPGCSCPDGTMCGPSGGCLTACIPQGELGETCADPAAVCVNGFCYKNPCDTLSCKADFDCKVQEIGGTSYGICVEVACSNVCCGAGQVCSAGLCVANNCGNGCPEGQTCAGGACVDSCTVLSCAAPLVCKKGLCLDPCVADPGSCNPSSGAGGSFNVGGGAGMGGAAGAGTGGSAGGAAGSGTGGGGNGSTGSNKPGGCGCRTSDSSPSDAEWLAGLTLLGAAVARRRIRARKSRPARA